MKLGLWILGIGTFFSTMGVILRGVDAIQTQAVEAYKAKHPAVDSAVHVDSCVWVPAGGGAWGVTWKDSSGLMRRNYYALRPGMPFRMTCPPTRDEIILRGQP